MTNIVTKQYYLCGRVQGVWCRDFVTRKARAGKINGWVRNLKDGRVEVMAQGSGTMLEVLEIQLHIGPPLASIDRVECKVIETPSEVYVDFKQIETVQIMIYIALLGIKA